MTHFVGTLGEKDLAVELLTTLCAHDDFRRPANQLGFAPQGAEGVTRARRHPKETQRRAARLVRQSAETS